MELAKKERDVNVGVRNYRGVTVRISEKGGGHGREGCD